MKTKLLKLALCAMAALPMGAWGDIDFGSEATVSTTTNWTFGELTAETNYKTYTNINGLYLRTNQPGRSFTVKSFAETDMVYGDNYHLPSTNYLYVNKDATYTGDDALTATSTAGDASNKGRGMIAINATVAGTMYVKIKGTTSGKVIRFYFADGTTITGSSSTSITSDGTIQEISYTSTKAGSFFVGGITTGTSEIYGVRFVPTSEKKDEWVYIGSTGYATRGDTSGKDIESLPDGLTAYKATAGTNSVTLTSLEKMRRYQGYVLKGTANTNYGLTYGGTDLDASYNGGDMARVSADMANFEATEEYKESTYNRYILGNDGGTAKFFKPSGSGTLKKGKAYLRTLNTLTPASEARGIDIIFEDETTAINAVATKIVNDGKYYNLQGVEVAHPTKGLYIVNGKKVFIK